ncbi:Uncharacterised protein [Mycobacteroides abscessus subsp. massiliense]|nr:Uncharacterised protein [Mycobacteroides abscessus subsp. massiliense]
MSPAHSSRPPTRARSSMAPPASRTTARSSTIPPAAISPARRPMASRPASSIRTGLRLRAHRRTEPRDRPGRASSTRRNPRRYRRPTPMSPSSPSAPGRCAHSGSVARPSPPPARLPWAAPPTTPSSSTTCWPRVTTRCCYPRPVAWRSRTCTPSTAPSSMVSRWNSRRCAKATPSPSVTSTWSSRTARWSNRRLPPASAASKCRASTLSSRAARSCLTTSASRLVPAH